MNFASRPLALAAALLLSACSLSDAPRDNGTTLTWHQCSDELGLECATLRVPTDYSKSEVNQID